MSQADQNVKQQIRPEQTVKQEVIVEQTTKSEIRSESTQDFFVTYKQNVERYFENMENSIPKYYQTLLELQQEYLQACENMFKATITVQKEFVSKTGLNLEQSTASKIVIGTTDSAIKARKIRDQILLTTIDTAKDNIKEWNNRIPDVEEFNRKIMQYWISSFTTRKN